MSGYIEQEPKKLNTKGAKKMSAKKALELPQEKPPRAIKVKTLVIIGVFILSHALVFWAGTRAQSAWDGLIDRAVSERTAETPTVTAEAAPLKASQ